MLTRTLGIFEDIMNGFRTVFSPIIEWLANTIGGFFDSIKYDLLEIVYNILKVFYLIIDFVQLIFRKIAGLDSYMMEGSSEIMTGDITLMLLKSDAIMNVLFAFLAIAVILLFITTFIAIIKNQYDTWDGKVTVGRIIGLSLKALFSFIFVPIICYFGIFVSNGLLQTVDEATRSSKALTISGEIFAASACDSNRILLSQDFWEEFVQNPELNMNGALMQGVDGDTGKQRILAARNVDNAFASLTANNNSGLGFTTFDYKNTEAVMQYYDLMKFNWLLAFVACFFISAALLVATMGVIQRFFELAILFVVGPPLMALMPIDKGSAFKKWRQMFVEKTLIMYGTVIAINFFFVLVPIFQRISLFTTNDALIYGENAVYLFNALVRILFILCGALIIKDASKMLNTLITGSDKAGDLFSSGGNMMGGLNRMNSSMQKTAQSAGQAAKKGLKLLGVGRDKDEGGDSRKGGGGGNNNRRISDGRGRWERFKDGASNAGDKLRSFGGGVRDGLDTVRDGIGEAGDKLRSFGGGVRDGLGTARDKLSTVAGAAVDGYDSTSAKVNALKQRALDKAREKPLSARLGSGMASVSHGASVVNKNLKKIGKKESWRKAGGVIKNSAIAKGSAIKANYQKAYAERQAKIYDKKVVQPYLEARQAIVDEQTQKNNEIYQQYKSTLPPEMTDKEKDLEKNTQSINEYWTQKSLSNMFGKKK